MDIYNNMKQKHFTKSTNNKNNMDNGLPYYKRVKWKIGKYLNHLLLWTVIIIQLLYFPGDVYAEDIQQNKLPLGGANVTCQPACLTTQYCDTSKNNVIQNETDNVTGKILGKCKPCSNICLDESGTQMNSSGSGTQNQADLCRKVCPGKS